MPDPAAPTPVPAACVPLSLTVHEVSRVLEVVFDALPGGSGPQAFRIPFELLRISSPAAEVMGHGPGQEVLQTGKRDVTLVQLDPVGHYGVRPTFSDGHDSGIYTWPYLYELGRDQEQLWQRYLQRLAHAGVDRDAPMPGKGCSTGAGCASR